jgi:stage II sporulation protein D
MHPDRVKRSLFRSTPFWGAIAGAALIFGLGSRLQQPAPTPSPKIGSAAKPVAAAPAKPKPSSMIRIGLTRFSGRPSIEIKPLAAAHLMDGNGRRVASLKPGVPITVTADFATAGVVARGKGLRHTARDLVLSGGLTRIGKRRFPGTIRFFLGGQGVELVNQVEIEQYLAGVLPGELPRGFGVEAQKAQAVAARSYALVQRGKHGDFDLCDRPHCQMYVGVTPSAPRALAAVRATRHEVLWHEDDVVYAFYSADCGGVSTEVKYVPLRDKPAHELPYLAVVKDAPAGRADYCAGSPYHAWTRRYTRQELQDRLNKEPETYVGALTAVKTLKLDPSGRVDLMELQGLEPPPATVAVAAAETPPLSGTPIVKQVSGWVFRRSAGELALKSTLWSLDQPDADTFRFRGAGFGHGLGLCQIGANGMAQSGKSYREILEHYYPGTRVAKL